MFLVKNRGDGRYSVTPQGVRATGTVAEVSKRALAQVEAERVRDRIVELYKEKGTQQAVEAYCGISQQSVGKLIARTMTAGYHVASQVAEADRVPVEVLLEGVPTDLYRAMMARRWPEHVLVAVGKLSSTIAKSRSYSEEDWGDVLRRTEEALGEIARSLPRPGR